MLVFCIINAVQNNVKQNLACLLVLKPQGKGERKGILTEMGSVEDGMLQTEEEEAVLIKNRSETPIMKT